MIIRAYHSESYPIIHFHTSTSIYAMFAMSHLYTILYFRCFHSRWFFSCNQRIPRRVVLIRDVFSITRIWERAENLASRYFFSFSFSSFFFLNIHPRRSQWARKKNTPYTAVIRIGAKRSSAYYLAKFRRKWRGSSLSFFSQAAQRSAHRCCKRSQHLARPRPVCIKLDGDVLGREDLRRARCCGGTAELIKTRRPIQPVIVCGNGMY